MKYIKSYQLFESSINTKTIIEYLNYIESLSNKTLIFLDTETTGIGGPIMHQLTQISAIAIYINNMKLNVIDEFNEKISLTTETKEKFEEEYEPGRTRKDTIEKFNHYYDSLGKPYLDEQETIKMFIEWCNSFGDIILVAQNINFDMDMIKGRYNDTFPNYDELDTKEIIRLYIIPIYQKLAEIDNTYQIKLDKIGTSNRDNGLISSSLAHWSPEFEIDTSKYHDALFDCYMMKKLFEKSIEIMLNNKYLDIQKYQLERLETY